MKKVISTNKSLTKKNIIGYAMGDLGGCMTFAILGSFLLPYYTEVAGLSTSAVAIMFALIKVWDAINDPMMGAIMDKIFAKTHNKNGKFRPWMIRSTPLLLISAVLMFSIPRDMNAIAKLVWAYVTYLLYEASYTMFNIPYGSLLSAMASDEGERAQLSSARGFGAMIGNLVPMMIFPIIINATKDNPAFGYTFGISLCAVIGFVACMASSKWTIERSTLTKFDDPTEESNVKFADILVVFKKNRAFVGIAIAAMGATIAQTAGQTFSIYMYRDVLQALPMMGLATVGGMGLSFLALIAAPKFVKKIGIDKTVQISLIIGAIFYSLLFILPTNVWVYMIVASVGQCFTSIPVLMQWGMVGDAIDYNEYLTGKRTEGSIYGTFNLFRRMGQAFGATFAASILGVIGYNATLQIQAANTISNIKICVIAAPILGAIISYIGLRYIWNITPELREKIAAKKQEA